MPAIAATPPLPSLFDVAPAKGGGDGGEAFAPVLAALLNTGEPVRPGTLPTTTRLADTPPDLVIPPVASPFDNLPVPGDRRPFTGTDLPQTGTVQPVASDRPTALAASPRLPAATETPVAPIPAEAPPASIEPRPITRKPLQLPTAATMRPARFGRDDGALADVPLPDDQEGPTLRVRRTTARPEADSLALAVTMPLLQPVAVPPTVDVASRAPSPVPIPAAVSASVGPEDRSPVPVPAGSTVLPTREATTPLTTLEPRSPSRDAGEETATFDRLAPDVRTAPTELPTRTAETAPAPVGLRSPASGTLANVVFTDPPAPERDTGTAPRAELRLLDKGIAPTPEPATAGIAAVLGAADRSVAVAGPSPTTPAAVLPAVAPRATSSRPTVAAPRVTQAADPVVSLDAAPRPVPARPALDLPPVADKALAPPVADQPRKSVLEETGQPGPRVAIAPSPRPDSAITPQPVSATAGSMTLAQPPAAPAPRPLPTTPVEPMTAKPLANLVAPAPAIDPAQAMPVILPALQAFGAALMRAASAERRPVARDDDPALPAIAPAAMLAATVLPTLDPTPVDTTRARWPEAMLARIEHLRDAADAPGSVADARIRLHPDALGTVDVAVRRDGDAVHVRFTAAEPATTRLLADAQPRLADLAEARGLRLTQTGAQGSGDAGAQSQGDRRQPAPEPSRGPSPSLRAAASAPTPTDPDTDDRIA